MRTLHPRLKVKEPRSGRSEHRHAARLKCGLSLRLAKRNALATHERGDKTRKPEKVCLCACPLRHRWFISFQKDYTCKKKREEEG